MELTFEQVLLQVQEYISKNYSNAVTNAGKRPQLQAYIESYLHHNEIRLPGWSTERLTARLCDEMAEYSILTPYLNREDVEEINVNGWDDIAVVYTDGHSEKLTEHFLSPNAAADVMKRLLEHSGMIIDKAKPLSQGHLPGNARITVLGTPIMDGERGVGASIRLLHPSKITREHLVANGCATDKMLDFLHICLLYGVPFVIAGATSAGKTTLLNVLLRTVPDEKRIFTIETGARELTLLRRENGRIRNNVVHALSKQSESAAYSVTQEDLVLAALRFDPDVIVVGEMRDAEAFAAVEACLTGHTVVSTVHAASAPAAHLRMGQLCQKRFPMDIVTASRQAAQAFPLVVYEHKGRDNTRRVMNISECVSTPDGGAQYRTLFRFVITRNEYTNGVHHTVGHFDQPELMSDSLRERLIQNGVPQPLLDRFLTKEAMT